MRTLNMDILKQMALEQAFYRGMVYYEEGAVIKFECDEGVLRGRVEGKSGTIYTVSLSTKKPFGYQCTCPYTPAGSCKHVVALGLAWIYEGNTFLDEKDKQQSIRRELDVIFTGMDQDDLISFLIALISEDSSIKVKLLTFFENDGHTSIPSIETKIKSLMEKALTIVDDYNAHGGGPEYKEEKCYEWLGQILTLLEEETISPECREEIIKDFMKAYHFDNLGFEDIFKEIIKVAAKSKEDWELIIESLKATGKKSHEEWIMEIYLHGLEDDEKYLEMRRENLEMGQHYYDLVEYYHQKGEEEQAVRTALEGEELGRGYILDNITYVKNYYEKRGDFDKAKEYAIKEFKYKPNLEMYKSIIENSRSEEEKEESRGYLKDILHTESRIRHASLLAAIYFHEENFDKVLEFVREGLVYAGTYEKILIEKYPQKMMNYYKKNVQELIMEKKRKSYRKAVEVAFKIKAIYFQLQDAEGWTAYLRTMLRKYPRHSAFQDEFQRLS